MFGVLDVLALNNAMSFAAGTAVFQLAELFQLLLPVPSCQIMVVWADTVSGRTRSGASNQYLRTTLGREGDMLDCPFGT
jgi:hypothetical protein